MITNLPGPRGRCSGADTMRAENGSLGSTDAQSRRRPADVLEARVFWVVAALVDCS